MGRRKVPVFSIVATDQRSARDGRYIEDLGRYHPLEQPARIRLNEDRIQYWLEQGAQPSDTVRSILSKRGLLLAHHLKKKGKSEPQIQEAVEAHRERWEEKGEEIKLTAEARRQQALEAERQRVKELEEEEARRRAEEAKRKKEEEEAQAAEAADAEAADAEAADATAEDGDAGEAATEADGEPAPDADEAADADAHGDAEATAEDTEEPADDDDEADEDKDA